MSNRFYYKKSRLNQLRGFCATVQEGCSARKAAVKLGLEPTTITLQIRSLEEELDVKLFERTPNNRFKITEKGQEFYEMAIERVQSMESLFDQFLNKLSKKEENTLNIAAHVIAISHVLPKYIKQYNQKTKSKIKYNLSNLKKEEMLKKVLSDEIDFALYPVEQNPSLPKEFEVIPAFDYEPVLIVNKKHPLAKTINQRIELEELAKHNFLHVDKFIVLKSFQDMMKHHKMESSIGLINGNWEILKKLVKSNLGITIFGKLYIEKEEEEDLVIKDVSNLLPKMMYAIVIKKGKILKKTALDFIKTMEKDFNTQS